MPARLLRRDAMGVFAANTWKEVLAADVPAARALVGNIIVTNNAGAPVTFSLAIEAAPAGAGRIADAITLQVGEPYKETGVVIPAGLNLSAMTPTANGVTVTFMGEEVDN